MFTVIFNHFGSGKRLRCVVALAAPGFEKNTSLDCICLWCYHCVYKPLVNKRRPLFFWHVQFSQLFNIWKSPADSEAYLFVLCLKTTHSNHHAVSKLRLPTVFGFFFYMTLRCEYNTEYKCACGDGVCFCYRKSKGSEKWEKFQIANKDQKGCCLKVKRPLALSGVNRYIKCYCKDGGCLCYKLDRCGHWKPAIKAMETSERSASPKPKPCCNKAATACKIQEECKKKVEKKEQERKCCRRRMEKEASDSLCIRKHGKGENKIVCEKGQSANYEEDTTKYRISCRKGSCVSWKNNGDEWEPWKTLERQDKKNRDISCVRKGNDCKCWEREVGREWKPMKISAAPIPRSSRHVKFSFPLEKAKNEKRMSDTTSKSPRIAGHSRKCCCCKNKKASAEKRKTAQKSSLDSRELECLQSICF